MTWSGIAQAAPGGWTQAQVNTGVQKAVAYIDTQQNVNGSYGSAAPIAETGMALVAYGVLANGSFSSLPANYQTHVQNAITWLLSQQATSGPNIGSWADFGSYYTYSTGTAIAGLSPFSSVNASVPAAITAGRTFLSNEFQGSTYTGCSSADGSGTASYCGGWNYDTGKGRSDESNTGFAMFGLSVTGGVPAAIQSEDVGWQHHIQEISTNTFFATRNDGGGSYQPGINSGAFSSNALDTGTMLFSLAGDSVAGTDAHVVAGLNLGQDVLDEYELQGAAAGTSVYHSGASRDGTCVIGSGGCDWFTDTDGGYHYSMFALTKGLGDYITPNLTVATNWYAKVVDLLLSQQAVNGSWPQDGRDDASALFATELSVASLGLVAVKAPTLPTSATATATLGGSISDTATLSNIPSNARGTIRFLAFSDADCRIFAFFSDVAVRGPGTYYSGKFYPQLPGTYRWIASYSGDHNSEPGANPLSGKCTDSGETSTVVRSGGGRP